MRIIIDGFGGDAGPLTVLRGCQEALNEIDVEIIVTGDKTALESIAKENNISSDRIKFHHAPDRITMCDDPTEALKSLSNSSMSVGAKLLSQGEGDAFVSGGNTGALVVVSTMVVKRIKGVKRPAIATVLPTSDSKFLLLDVGANVECRPEMLAQFGVMGSIYMKKLFGIESPKVGLVNIGEEETKGTKLQIEANQILKNESINYIGNIEPRELSASICDVAVADGFTGNVILKLMEGMGIGFSKMLKNIFLKNVVSKFAALLLKDGIAHFKKTMDYSEYGGAVLLGISKPVIKAHGSSNSKAFKNAILQAAKAVEQSMTSQIEKAFSK